MRILADENVDRTIVEWLRARGHDVRWVAESSSGASDRRVLSDSWCAGRIVVTFDLDFGELVYRDQCDAEGIVLIRIRARNPATLLAHFTTGWPRVESRVQGHFVVMGRSKIRIRPLARP